MHFPVQIHRCYSVWNSSKRVILLPCFLLFCGSGEYFSQSLLFSVLKILCSACGYTFIGLSKEDYQFRQLLVAFLFATVTLNILVTVLMGMFSHDRALPSHVQRFVSPSDISFSGSNLVDSAESPVNPWPWLIIEVQYYDCYDVSPLHSANRVHLFSGLSLHEIQKSGIRHDLFNIRRVGCGFSQRAYGPGFIIAPALLLVDIFFPRSCYWTPA